MAKFYFSDRSKCPGPLAYYDSIGCKPIVDKSVNGCAYQYNCDEVKSLDFKKCHVNGHAYDVGERLRDEDANPCDIGCTCAESDTPSVLVYDSVLCFEGYNWISYIEEGFIQQDNEISNPSP